MSKKHLCVVSGKAIPKERVAALRMLGTPENQWTCVEYSLTKPRQGIFLGESGTSQLLMVDRVYDDSVRAVFKAASNETDAEYKAKDIEYYAGEEDDKVEDPLK